jgi:TRAP-type C4-dicarboxylate transport system permease small subunit
MRKILMVCNRISGLLSAYILFFMMILLVADVTFRWTVGTPLPGTIEFIMVFMAAIVFLGLSYTEESGSHIRVEVLFAYIPERAKVWLDLLGWIVGCFFFALIAWKGFESAMRSFEMRECYPGLVRVPVYPARFLVVLGSIFICLQYVLQIISRIFSAGEKSESPKSS